MILQTSELIKKYFFGMFYLPRTTMSHKQRLQCQHSKKKFNIEITIPTYFCFISLIYLFLQLFSVVTKYINRTHKCQYRTKIFQEFCSLLSNLGISKVYVIKLIGIKQVLFIRREGYSKNCLTEAPKQKKQISTVAKTKSEHTS